jgi:DNA-binding transcriptional regulator PaaX
MKIKDLVKKATEGLHGAIKSERRPRSIVFDSITDLSRALLRQHAHSVFERDLGAKDHNWLLWYAAYIARE